MAALTAREFGRVFAARAAGAFLVLATVLVVVRQLSVGDAGIVLVGWASVQLLAGILRCGTDVVLLRVTSEAHSLGDFRRARGIARRVALLALTASSMAAVLLVVLREQCSNLLFDGESPAAVAYFALCLPPLVMSLLAVEVLKGTGHVALGSFVQTGAISLLTLVTLALSSPGSPAGFAAAHLVASVLTAGASASIAVGAIGGFADRREPSPGEVMESARPTLGFEICRVTTLWCPMVGLALVGTNEMLGVFGFASRIAMVVNLAVVAAGNILSPQLARLALRGQLAGIEDETRRMSRAMLAGGSALFVGVLLAAEPLLGFVGLTTTAGTATLSVLVAAQVVRAVTVSATLALAMLHDERQLLRDSALSMSTAVLLTVPLTIMWGAFGASLVALAAVAVQGSMNVRSLRKLHSISPLPGSAKLARA